MGCGSRRRFRCCSSPHDNSTRSCTADLDERGSKRRPTNSLSDHYCRHAPETILSTPCGGSVGVKMIYVLNTRAPYGSITKMREILRHKRARFAFVLVLSPVPLSKWAAIDSPYTHLSIACSNSDTFAIIGATMFARMRHQLRKHHFARRHYCQP